MANPAFAKNGLGKLGKDAMVGRGKYMALAPMFQRL